MVSFLEVVAVSAAAQLYYQMVVGSDHSEYFTLKEIYHQKF
jgi:hypothetical protein